MKMLNYATERRQRLALISQLTLFFGLSRAKFPEPATDLSVESEQVTLGQVERTAKACPRSVAPRAVRA